MSLYGRDIVKDTVLSINYGQKYGLIGQNGSGKSALLSAIGSRELPIPKHIDIWHLTEEAKPTNASALFTVMETVAYESRILEQQLEELMEVDPESEVIEMLCERLDVLDLDKLEPRARSSTQRPRVFGNDD